MKSKIEKTAAAAIVGIGLIVGSIGEFQAACNPPVYDVCFHKDNGGDWSAAGEATMYVDFDVPCSKGGTTYRIEWWGLYRYVDPNRWWTPDPYYLVWGKYPFDDVVTLSRNENALEHTFWFDPVRNPSHDPFTYDSYGVSIYEYNPRTRKGIKWVASVDFRSGQEASYVSLYSEYYSDLSVYYCTIDWNPGFPGLLSGYHGPFWSRLAPWPRGLLYYVEGWTGDVGSPRSGYERRCSREISPPQP